MFEYSFKKFFTNFGEIVPYIIVKILFDLVLVRLCFQNITGGNIQGIVANSSGFRLSLNGMEFRTVTATVVIFIIISLVVQPLFIAFIRLLFKKMLHEEEIYQGDTLRESFSYYWRIVGIYLIFLVIGIAVMVGGMLVAVLFGFIPVIRVAVIFALIVGAIYVATILTPCVEYMVYYDSDTEEALRGGVKVGKYYFWSIFGLTIVKGILVNLLNKTNGVGLLAAAVMMFISLIIEGIFSLYVMNLCRCYDSEEVQGY